MARSSAAFLKNGNALAGFGMKTGMVFQMADDIPTIWQMKRNRQEAVQRPEEGK
jgi:geranylgeranyl pyrophosphate synthase